LRRYRKARHVLKEPIVYHVVLFPSVNMTMWAVKVLTNKGLQHKLIPMPREISYDCGVCIRVDAALVATIKEALSNVMECQDIRPYISAGLSKIE